MLANHFLVFTERRKSPIQVKAHMNYYSMILQIESDCCRSDLHCGPDYQRDRMERQLINVWMDWTVSFCYIIIEIGGRE